MCYTVDNVQLFGYFCVMNPKITVVISAYNERRHIKRTVCSALNQSLREIEVIVVDDASTDGTVEAVKSLMVQDNRLRLVEHGCNKGLSQTRLTGLDAANGEYIQFLDADDVIERDSMKLLYEKATENDSDIVMMGMRHCHKWLRMGFVLFSPARMLKKDIYDTRELMPVLLGKNGLTLSLCDKLYRASFLRGLSLKAESRFMGEDMIMNMRIFNAGAKLSWIDHIGYHYTSGGASSLSPNEMWKADKSLYLRCCEVLSELKVVEPVYKQALATGVADAFISCAASRLVNPFANRLRLEQWLADELNDDFWNDVVPLLVERRHRAVAEHDAGGVLSIARQTLASHRASYILSLFFR